MQSIGKAIMILSNSIKPNQTLYYLGGILISCLKEQPSQVIDSVKLFEVFKNSLSVKVTFTQYMFTLDWLYLLDMIEVNDEGDIIVCF